MPTITDWNKAVKEPIAMLESLAKEAGELAQRTQTGLARGHIVQDGVLAATRMATAAEDTQRLLHEASMSLAVLATAHTRFYRGPEACHHQ